MASNKILAEAFAAEQAALEMACAARGADDWEISDAAARSAAGLCAARGAVVDALLALRRLCGGVDAIAERGKEHYRAAAVRAAADRMGEAARTAAYWAGEELRELRRA